MKKILNTLDSCILAGKTLLHLRAGDRLNRIGDAEKRWITTESGSHIQLDENGTIIAGAGGKFNGKNIKEMGGTKKFTKYQTNAERQSLDIKRKRYSVSERFGENHYRISGKLLPQSTTNFNDDFSISDRNGEHFIKDSNDNWLRDSSGSAISFDTEKKAKDFLSKIKEVAKDLPAPAKSDSNKKLSELRKNLASAQTEQDYKKAQLELMQHTIYNHSETSDYNKINSENNDLMALVKARFPIESKKLTKTKQSPYGELSLIEDVYGQKHWVKSDFKDSKQSRLKTFTEKGEPRKDGGIVLKDNIHSDYLTAKPESNKTSLTQTEQDDKNWHSLKHEEKVKMLVDKLGMNKKEAGKMANYALTSPFRGKSTDLDSPAKSESKPRLDYQVKIDVSSYSQKLQNHDQEIKKAARSISSRYDTTSQGNKIHVYNEVTGTEQGVIELNLNMAGDVVPAITVFDESRRNDLNKITGAVIDKLKDKAVASYEKTTAQGRYDKFTREN